MTAERQAFPARTDALPQVSAFVEQRCVALGASRETTLLLMLLAEELFINTVVHGYREDARCRVNLTVRGAGAEVELVAEDTAEPFNPFDDVPDTPVSVEDERVGGYGRRLLAGLPSRQAYAREGRRNRVTVGVPKVRVR